MDKGLLFLSNKRKIKISRYLKNRKFIYTCKSDTLNNNELKKVTAFVSTVEEASAYTKLPIIFDMGKLKLNDKISYILFEYICYYLIKYKKCKCFVKIKFENNILSYYANSSPLFILSYDKIRLSKEDITQVCEQYIKSFEKHYGLNHIRQIIKKEDWGTNTNSKLCSDIEFTLKSIGVDDSQALSISEVISELVDNSGEHANADCLVDIDITPEHKKVDCDGFYYGVNIVVFDFSDYLLGENIEKILKKTPSINNWYKQLYKAWKNHRNYWNASYTEKDFFIMAAFQNKISSRSEQYITGGTGLTRLISALEFQSDAYRCFIWTGNRKLEFHHELMQLDKHEWVGFNKEKNFTNHPPERKIFKKTDIYFPGTAYNLNFILKKENDNYE